MRNDIAIFLLIGVFLRKNQFTLLFSSVSNNLVNHIVVAWSLKQNLLAIVCIQRSWILSLHLAQDLCCSFALELSDGVHLALLLLMKFIATAGFRTVLLLLAMILIGSMLVWLLNFWHHGLTVDWHRIGKELVKHLILSNLVLNPASLAHYTLLGWNGYEVVAQLFVELRTLLQCGLNIPAKLVLQINLLELLNCAHLDHNFELGHTVIFLLRNLRIGIGEGWRCRRRQSSQLLIFAEALKFEVWSDRMLHQLDLEGVDLFQGLCGRFHLQSIDFLPYMVEILVLRHPNVIL